jgi:hypothetical protein
MWRPPGGRGGSETPPYTAAEKQWLEARWLDEFHFLRRYQLSCIKQEDREEGRRILRALIKEDNELSDSSLAIPLDYTVAERQWLVKCWGGATNFLKCHGLDHMIEKHRESGRRKAREMIKAQSELHTQLLKSKTSSHKDESNRSETPPPYTAAEKQWLEARYGNEFRFLRRHQLSLCKKADREEGRRILRALMNEDKIREDKLREEIREEIEAGDTLPYTDAEKMWLNTYWGHESKFLKSHGLDHLKEGNMYRGRRIARVYMRTDKKDQEQREARRGM